MSRSVVRRLVAAVLAIASIATATASSAGAGEAPAATDRVRGIVTAGLRRTAPGSACHGLYAVGTSCTHGPDPAPEGVDVTRHWDPPAPDLVQLAGSGGTSPAVSSTTAVPCYGDGVSGMRVQALYVHAADVVDHYATVAPNIRAWAGRVDATFASSAAETGGVRHVRWVTDAGCVLNVADVQVSSTGDDTMDNTISQLHALGYNRSDRKYLVWMDANIYCGIGEEYYDDSASTSNTSNGKSTIPGEIARVDNGCWGLTASTEAHELMHTLGGVQLSAPHSSGYGHCTDESDRMCYADAPGVTVSQVCPTSHEPLFDCNHDDYFSTSPSGGSYLATHWNTANSSFLATSDPASTASTTSTTTVVAPVARSGYWMVGADGRVWAFGDAVYYGDAAGRLPAGARATHIEPTPSGNGYWVVSDRGNVYPFGDAVLTVLPPVLGIGESVTSLSSTRSGRGFWLYTSSGRALPYGDAVFDGDISGYRLNGPVIGSVATPSGLGYFMVGSDGGIFSFGDAAFHGSMGGRPLNAPVVGLAPTPDNAGYWLVAGDGGIFAFSAPFKGSMGGTPLNKPVIGAVVYGDGYLMVGSDGGIFDFSSKPFVGSLGSNPPSTPIVGVAPLSA